MSTNDRAVTQAAEAAHGEHDHVGEHGLAGEHGHVGEHGLTGAHESLAPITLAAGIGLLGFGVLTSLVFSLVGLAVMAWALGRWIEEMRHG